MATLGLLLGVLTTATLSTQASADETQVRPAAVTTATSDGAPVTVPAVQAWQPGGADFVLPRGLVLVEVDAGDAEQLRADAETFAGDLRALTGRQVQVRVRVDDTASPTGTAPGQGVGAIRLALEPTEDEHGPEQYSLTVDGTISLSGATPAGVFAGTRTVLQLLRQSDRVSGGTITDWPAYPERSLMVDNGRKYFTPEWARRQIRELAYLKLNQFHWHISDNAGFRIESKRHPEIVSAEHWTQDQVRDLVAYAEKYHVEVIPEIDMPGHMQHVLRAHPDLQVVDRNGNRNGNNIDPTNPAARAFVKDLLDELVPLFNGRYVHTGGDEFTGDWNAYPVLTDWARDRFGPEANAHDAVIDFTNFVDQVVRSHGKTMRMWNDGAQGGSVVEANRDIVLEYWSVQHGSVRAQQFLDAGYQLINANRDFLYDVPGVTPSYNNVDPRVIYDVWDMSQWHGALGPNLTDPHAPGILGGQLHVWNDLPNAMTQDQEAGRLAMPLRAIAEQLWGSARAPENWDELATNAFLAGREPRWTPPSDGPDGDEALGDLVWSSARERRDCHEAALVDGDPTTRWCGPKTGPQSVVIDLGRSVDLGRLVLRWEAAFAKSYTLEVSDDLRTWRPLTQVSAGDGGVDLLSVTGQGRYLKLEMTERGTAYGYSLYEIEAFERGALVPAEYSVEVDPEAVLVESERPAGATVTVHNASADATTVTWRATADDGFVAEPSSGTLRVPAGGSATGTFTVASAAGDTHEGSVNVSVTGRSGAHLVRVGSADLRVSVPQGDLADAFSNVSTTSDDDISPPGLGAGFDGAASSYSAQALAAAGITPGKSLSVAGVDLTWPDVPAGKPDNVVANGQSFVLRGQGSTVGVLAASTYGAVARDWVVHYADGSSDTVRATSPDWSSTPPPGATLVADMPYRNNAQTGRTARRTMVFLLRLPVQADKRVEAVTLPAVSADVVRGVPALHVFALGIG